MEISKSHHFIMHLSQDITVTIPFICFSKLQVKDIFLFLVHFLSDLYSSAQAPQTKL